MNVLLFIGAIGVYVYQGTIRNKFFIFISIIPVAVLANTVRIIITGLIGHFKGENSAISFYDNMSGMLVFGISMLIVYIEILIFKSLDRKREEVK